MSVSFNPVLHVKKEDLKTPHSLNFKFCTVNLGNGVNEQKIKPFDGRAPHHIADFSKMSPDIICMQEFRRFPESKIQPEDFMYQVEKSLGHKMVSAFRNPSDLAMGQGISFDKKKFFAKQTITKWLSDTPDD